MGLSITDSKGKLKDQQAIFTEVVDKLSAYESGMNKDALAVALLENSG